jgi:recombinational DNA repair ATPase RecF
MINDLEITVKTKKRDRIAELERRVARCEEVARNYQMMFEQLERHITTLADRQGNIQALYDYMVKVGSTVVTKRKDYVAFLNVNNDPKRLKDEECQE